jgi:CHASE2 domain-containing sensor protein
MVEIFGYLASLFTISSFLMKDIFKLRVLNLIACIMFIIYGFWIHAIPIIIVNTLVALVNIYYIIKRKI